MSAVSDRDGFWAYISGVIALSVGVQMLIPASFGAWERGITMFTMLYGVIAIAHGKVKAMRRDRNEHVR